MKNISKIIIVVFLAVKVTFGQQACDGINVYLTEAGQCNYDPWITVFEDHFEGNALDKSRWVLPNQGVIRNFDHSKEKQWYANTGHSPSLPIENNVQINNGILHLISNRESTPIIGTYVVDWNTNPWTYATESFSYTSGEIDSKYKFGYGWYEIRCKIPTGKGFWPAFWIYGENSSGVNNEIDIFEFWDNNTNNQNMSVHYNGQMCITDSYGPDYSQNFHTFTVFWDEYRMEWYVDGYLASNLKRLSTKYYTINGQAVGCASLDPGSYVSEKVYPKDPMNIIVNLAIQTGNFQPDLNTIFPSSLEIDYIKYSKQMKCKGAINASHISELELSKDTYNFYIGSTITLGGAFTIQNGQQLDVEAKDEVLLNPGFTSESGSDFYAHINSSICTTEKSKEINLVLNDVDSVSYSKLYNDNSFNKIIEEGIEFKAFPNPNNGNIYIELDRIDKRNLELRLLNIYGTIIYSSTVQGKTLSLNMEDFEKGIYFLKLIDIEKNRVYVKKILYR